MNSGNRVGFCGKVYTDPLAIIKTAESYSISFWYKVENFSIAGTLVPGVNQDFTSIPIVGNVGWTRYSSSLMVTNVIGVGGFIDLNTGGVPAMVADIYVSDIVVARSNIPASEWYPAPEDYEMVVTTGTTSQYYRGDKTWVTLDKSTVGLSAVDNTSDLNKPVSTATQTALNNKVETSVYTASDVLTKIKTVDGTGSGLDADLLDGNNSTAFSLSGHVHNAFTTTVNGFVPAPTSSTGKFLKDDGTWATAGGGASNLTGSMAIPDSAWSGNTNYNATLTVTGAALNDRVIVEVSASVYEAAITASATLLVNGWVSAVNTVKIWVRAGTYITVPASSTYYVTVLK